DVDPARSRFVVQADARDNTLHLVAARLLAIEQRSQIPSRRSERKKRKQLAKIVLGKNSVVCVRQRRRVSQRRRDREGSQRCRPLASSRPHWKRDRQLRCLHLGNDLAGKTRRLLSLSR